MGDPDTLADFLAFCSENYPADHTMVIFWNHGGGSVAGVAFDENYGYDSLTLTELHQAFDSVYDLSPEDPPVDVVGFDACLMASIDTAYTFSDIARYLVASEEMEPGIGWSYSGWLQELGDHPGMDGARLGQVICDSYMEACESYGMEDEITLSVADLSRIEPLLQAYESMGAEALANTLDNPGFFNSFGRRAEYSENYGGNTRDEGYANMVDLGDLASHCSRILPETTDAVQEALEDCILYQINGAYRENASGLSCYYSYDADLEDFYGFLEQGCSDSFKYLFQYGYEGTLTEEGLQYIQSVLDYEDEVPYMPDLSEDGEEEYPLELDEDYNVILNLDQDTLNLLKGVYFELAYMDPDNDLMLLLGQDNDLYADWDSGVFMDNFWGYWGTLNGYPVYREVAYEGEDYTVYSVPILLNGEEYNLRVVYDYEYEEYYILGARQGLDSTGMADRNLVQLKPGDEITTVHYASSISGDDDFEAVPVDTFTVTSEDDVIFQDEPMGDGIFLMMFELVDARNNCAYSQIVQYTVDGDDIYVEILE